jgi:adenosine deaminase CECR1
MWDSTMTDEFFVAVKEFDLSWDEIKLLSRNSLAHAFVPATLKQDLLGKYEEKIGRFERKMNKTGVAKLGAMPDTRRFVCGRYELCF